MSDRWEDIAETLSNGITGYLVSVAATYWLLPLWGYEPPISHAVFIPVMYLSLSMIRVYCLRRLARYWFPRIRAWLALWRRSLQ